MRVVLLVVLCACGRVGFDATDDARGAAAIDAPRDGQRDTPPSDAAEPNLVLHYAFDTAGFLVDSGPNGHDATCTTCPQPIAGRVGDGAAMFDGTTCLAVPDGLDLRPPTFTVALWLAGSAGNVDTEVVARPTGPTSNLDTFEITFASPVSITAGIEPNFADASAAPTGWTHVALVYDGVQAAIYIDGNLGAGVGAAAPGYASADDVIGCDLDAGMADHFFIGALDDVRIYDRALAQAEVAALAAQ